MSMTTRRMDLAAWLQLLLLSLLWGGSFLFNAIGVTGLPPLTLVLLRVALAAGVLNSVLGAWGYPLWRQRHHWRLFCAMGLLNNVVPFCLIVWGQTQIASGIAAILNATTPFFTLLLAHLWTVDERMTPGRLVGVLLGLAGAVLVIGPQLLRELGMHSVAELAVLAAALSYACAGIFGRRFADQGITPLVGATGQVTASTVLLLPVVLWVDLPWQLPPPAWTVWAAVAGLAIFSTALAYLIYFRLLAAAGASNLLLVTLLIPVSAVLLGSLFLGEVPDLRHFAGMGLIGAGLLVIDGRVLPFVARCFAALGPSERHPEP